MAFYNNYGLFICTRENFTTQAVHPKIILIPEIDKLQQIKCQLSLDILNGSADLHIRYKTIAGNKSQAALAIYTRNNSGEACSPVVSSNNMNR